MPDKLISFFSVLVNIKKKNIIEIYYNGDDSEDILTEELEDEKLSTKAAKMRSLFQIMFYNIHNGYQRIPLHIMNAAEVYKKCMSRKPTISFNKNGLCDCLIL